MGGILIISKQRAGSNLLRNMLKSTANIRNFGEVMYPTTRGWPGNFNDWYEGRYGNSIPLNRSAEMIEAIYSEYLSHLADLYPHFVIDIKYDSFMTISPSSYTVVDVPILLKLFMQRQYLIIHLTRSDRLAHLASRILSDSTGCYTLDSKSSSRPKISPIQINPELAEIMVNDYEKEISLFDWWVRHYDKVVQLDYETLSEPSVEARSSLLQELSVRAGSEYWGYVEPEFKRVFPNWEVHVSNAGDLKQRLSLTS